MPTYAKHETQGGGAGVMVRSMFAFAAGVGIALLVWDPAPSKGIQPVDSKSLSKYTAVRQRIVTDDDALPRLSGIESRRWHREDAGAGFADRWRSGDGRSTTETHRTRFDAGGTGGTESAAMTVLPHSRGPP